MFVVNATVPNRKAMEYCIVAPLSIAGINAPARAAAVYDGLVECASRKNANPFVRRDDRPVHAFRHEDNVLFLRRIHRLLNLAERSGRRCTGVCGITVAGNIPLRDRDAPRLRGNRPEAIGNNARHNARPAVKFLRRPCEIASCAHRVRHAVDEPEIRQHVPVRIRRRHTERQRFARKREIGHRGRCCSRHDRPMVRVFGNVDRHGERTYSDDILSVHGACRDIERDPTRRQKRA